MKKCSKCGMEKIPTTQDSPSQVLKPGMHVYLASRLVCWSKEELATNDLSEAVQEFVIAVDKHVDSPSGLKAIDLQSGHSIRIGDSFGHAEPGLAILAMVFYFQARAESEQSFTTAVERAHERYCETHSIHELGPLPDAQETSPQEG